MKILFINVQCGVGSTGRICAEEAQRQMARGHECRIAYARDPVPEEYTGIAYRIGSGADTWINALKARLLDNEGLNAVRQTKQLLSMADAYDPDLLWLHNIHGYFINYELLFRWIKSRPQMKVKWTLHDCWSFTGHCPHFTVPKCDRWQTQCHHCPERGRYPASLLLDRSAENHRRKRAAFTGVNGLTLITPSRWLADLTRKSFLSQYPVKVQNNTIDTEAFRPTPGDFRRSYGLQYKHIVLGVASVWTDRKGLGDFIRLRALLDDGFAIVLVGLKEKQIRALPEGVLGITRTNSKRELAELYTTADVFFNPTYEDTYPTVNLEAKACGTPVVTYRTGGSPESAEPENVFEPGDLQSVAIRLRRMCSPGEQKHSEEDRL